jgi:hypothetical protein
MKLHDALVYEIIKPNRQGEPTGDLIKIVGTSNIKYSIDEPQEFQTRAQHSLETIRELMAPDLTVTRLRPATGENPIVVVEVETDVDFDFGESMRQIRKYRKITREVRVIIPKTEEAFAPLYKSQGFRVWTWQATRIWECLRCGKMQEEEKILAPKCSACKTSEQRLRGLKDASFEEFI